MNWWIMFLACGKKKNLVVGNKAKGRIKTGVSRKQTRSNFPKNERFLPPDTHTYVCVSGGKKCSFFGKFDVLWFLETPVLGFAFLPYYRGSVSFFSCFLDFLRKKPRSLRSINCYNLICRNKTSSLNYFIYIALAKNC